MRDIRRLLAGFLAGALITAVPMMLLRRSSGEAAAKAKKFDEYCVSIWSFVSVVRTDLDSPKWRDQALERFSLRRDDVDRCAAESSKEMWDRFSTCRYKQDNECLIAIVRSVEKSIPLPPPE